MLCAGSSAFWSYRRNLASAALPQVARAPAGAATAATAQATARFGSTNMGSRFSLRATAMGRQKKAQVARESDLCYAGPKSQSRFGWALRFGCPAVARPLSDSCCFADVQSVKRSLCCLPMSSRRHLSCHKGREPSPCSSAQGTEKYQLESDCFACRAGEAGFGHEWGEHPLIEILRFAEIMISISEIQVSAPPGR